jgi:hypothetical protein
MIGAVIAPIVGLVPTSTWEESGAPHLAFEMRDHSHAIELPCIAMTTPIHIERHRQIRGLLLLALAAIIFAIYRAGIHNVFTHNWWHLW